MMSLFTIDHYSFDTTAKITITRHIITCAKTKKKIQNHKGLSIYL